MLCARLKREKGRKNFGEFFDKHGETITYLEEVAKNPQFTDIAIPLAADAISTVADNSISAVSQVLQSSELKDIFRQICEDKYGDVKNGSAGPYNFDHTDFFVPLIEGLEPN